MRATQAGASRPLPERRTRPASARFWIFAGLTAILALGGGTHVPAASLLLVRPVCVLAVAAIAIAPGRWSWSGLRPLAWLLAAWALVIAVQLAPLPPSLFLSLPGRAAFAPAATVAGHAQLWRPLSLAPDLTLDSLLSLLPALAALIGFAGLDERDRARTPPLLGAVVLASAVLGAAQLVGGPGSLAYPYESSDTSLPVGLLANRNHQAALMAIGIALAAWRGTSGAPGTPGAAVLAMAGVAFGAIALATGSRSGLVLGGAGAVLGFLAGGGIGRLRGSRRGWAVPAAIIALAGAVAGVAVLQGRAASIDRLADAGAIAADMRFRALPVMKGMVEIYAPFGVGFGAFDPVFRMHEPDRLLSVLFFNNAHDDFLEVLITGGLPAAAVLAAALLWFAGRAWFLVAGARDGADGVGRARDCLGLAVLALLAGASLSDYPLRTPLMAFVGALAACWAAARRRAAPLVSSETLG